MIKILKRKEITIRLFEYSYNKNYSFIVIKLEGEIN